MRAEYEIVKEAILKGNKRKERRDQKEKGK